MENSTQRDPTGVQTQAPPTTATTSSGRSSEHLDVLQNICCTALVQRFKPIRFHLSFNKSEEDNGEPSSQRADVFL